MSNHSRKIAYKRVLLTAVGFSILLLFSAAFGQAPTIERSPDPASGKDGYKVVTKYANGTTVTKKYQVVIIEGKKVEFLRESTRVDSSSGLKTLYDTIYINGDRVTTIGEIRWVNEVEVYREKREFEGEKVIMGSKEELGYDGKKRYYDFNLKKQEYDSEPKKDLRTSSCSTPKATVSMTGIFVDNAYDEINQFGANIDFSFYPGKTADTDTALPYIPKRTHTQFGVGTNVFIAFGSDGDFKFNLSGITAGPEIRFTKNNFSGTIQVQGGVAWEGVKFDDYKEKESSFALRTGITLDCWFSNTIGVEAAPQALMTKFGDKQEWSLMGGLGVIVKLGCGSQ